MFALCWFVLSVLASPFKSKSRLEAENAALRHQLIVLRRKVPGRVRLTNNDRWFFIQLYRWFPSILQLVTVVQPETLVRWHRAGLRLYWRWKSGLRGGRPQIETDLRAKNLPYLPSIAAAGASFSTSFRPAAVGLIFAWAIRKCDGWRNN